MCSKLLGSPVPGARKSTLNDGFTMAAQRVNMAGRTAHCGCLPPLAPPHATSTWSFPLPFLAETLAAALPSAWAYLQELIFFLKGRLAARYMWQRQNLAQLNSYFMVDCK